jgi:hypothetical protein
MIGPKDQQRKDNQMREPFGVLRAIDGSNAEGKESSENTGDCGIRA